MRSSRGWAPLLGWCAATLSSIVLASVAMLPVLRTAAPDDSALISVDRLRDSGDVAPIPLPSVPPVPSGAVPSPPPTASSPPSPSRSVSRLPAPSRSTPGPSPSTTRPPATAPQTATVEDGWTVTTDADGEKTYVRSFRTDGGQTVIRISGGRVGLISATPNDGFEVATVQNTPDNLAVYFNEPNHSFIVHAVWNVDRPFAQVSEVGN
jgi:hypothetical protein